MYAPPPPAIVCISPWSECSRANVHASRLYVLACDHDNCIGRTTDIFLDLIESENWNAHIYTNTPSHEIQVELPPAHSNTTGELECVGLSGDHQRSKSPCAIAADSRQSEITAASTYVRSRKPWAAARQFRFRAHARLCGHPMYQ